MFKIGTLVNATYIIRLMYPQITKINRGIITKYEEKYHLYLVQFPNGFLYLHKTEFQIINPHFIWL